MKRLVGIAAILFFLAVGTPAFAMSVIADYVYSGVPGDYILDFTVWNNIPAGINQDVYQFGVDLAHNASQESPTGWYDMNNVWTNTSIGGSSIPYTSNWRNSNAALDISSGSSLGGFKVHAPSIPDTIHFYALSAGRDAYNGADAFRTGTDPGWEGIASLAGQGGVVPEPASMLLMGIGLAGAALRRRRNKE